MAQVHPALRGKSQDEIDSIFDRLQDGLTRNFYGENNWMSSREQNEAIEKVAEIIEEYPAVEYTELLKAVADGEKDKAFDILKAWVENSIETVVDRTVYPSR